MHLGMYILVKYMKIYEIKPLIIIEYKFVK